MSHLFEVHLMSPLSCINYFVYVTNNGYEFLAYKNYLALSLRFYFVSSSNIWGISV